MSPFFAELLGEAASELNIFHLSDSFSNQKLILFWLDSTDNGLFCIS